MKKILISATCLMVLMLLFVGCTKSNKNQITTYATENSVCIVDNSPKIEKKRPIIKDGEFAHIETEWGNYKFGVVNATILPEEEYRDAVYQVSWEVQNESFDDGSDGLCINEDELVITDSNGYVISQMSLAWDGEWVNEDVCIIPGEKCITKFTYEINDDECIYLDVRLKAQGLTFRIDIENPDKDDREEREITEEATEETMIECSPIETDPIEKYNPTTSANKPEQEYSRNSSETFHQCEVCSSRATHQISGVVGQPEFYCEKHYKEITDILSAMESDVGKSSYSKHACEECSREGTHSIIGISGKTEYYCTEHYDELLDLMEILGLS